MKQKSLSIWVKAVIIGTGLCGVIVCFAVLPYLGKFLIDQNPELSSWFWPWLIFLWLAAVPCFIILVLGYMIAIEIGRDNSFSRKNAKLLEDVAVLVACDSVFFFAGNIILLLLNMSHPGVLLSMLFVVLVGIAVAVAAAAASHLVYKAAVLREENELTI